MERRKKRKRRRSKKISYFRGGVKNKIPWEDDVAVFLKLFCQKNQPAACHDDVAYSMSDVFMPLGENFFVRSSCEIF